MKILVVDDNIDTSELLAELLTDLGHDVRVAHDGAAAVREAQDFLPRLAFIDLGLPVLDGNGVARELRARQDGEPLTLVALSGHGQPDDVRRAREAGFDEHLTKPVEVHVLEAVIGRVGAS